MYLIIGQGAAGVSAAKMLKTLNPGLPVTIITGETDAFYSRVDLPDVIKERLEERDATLMDETAFAALGIECRMGQCVTRLVPEEKSVELASGERISYEKLLLATGSQPVIPPLPGLDATGIFTLWTMADARTIIKAANTSRQAVVIGAGLIGIKTALALKARGLRVTMIERLPRVMPRQLDETASGMIARRLEQAGIDLRTGTGVDSFIVEHGKVAGIQAGQPLGCDMVVCAGGVRPNTGLARAAGIKVEQGIVTDACMRTSMVDIFAAGDCAQALDPLTGAQTVPAIWPVAVEQGRHAAFAMQGKARTWHPGVAMNAVDVAGLPIISHGEIIESDGDAVLTAHHGDTYRKLVIRDHALRGALCVGDIRSAGVFGAMVLRQTPLNGLDPLSPAFSAADLADCGESFINAGKCERSRV